MESWHMDNSIPEIAYQRLNNLLSLRNSDQTPKIILKFQQLLQKYPAFYDGWIELGRYSREVGDRPQALQSFKSAVALKPSNVLPKMELVTECLQADEAEQALTLLEEILALESDHTPALIQLGKIYQEQQHNQKALECFQNVLTSKPKHLQAALHTATQLRVLGQYAEAEQQLLKTLVHHPQSISLLMELGDVQKAWNKPEQALLYYQSAFEVEPQRIQTGLKIAQILRDLHRFEETEKLLCQLLEQNPNNYSILTALGRLERCCQNRKGSLNWFQIASQYATSSAQKKYASLAISEDLHALNYLDEALAILKPLSEAWPNDIKIKLELGRLYSSQKDLPKATECYHTILQSAPSNLSTHIYLAQLYSNSGQIDKAINLLKNSPIVVQQTLQIQRQLGLLYRRQHNGNMAVKSFQQALELSPTDLKANLDLVNELQNIGSFQKAEQQLQQALLHHPQNPQILLQLGNVAQTQHQLPQALDYYKQAENLFIDKLEPGLKIAQAFITTQQLEKAEFKLNQLKEKYPDSYRLCTQFARLEVQRGNRTKALEWYQKSIHAASTEKQDRAAHLSYIDNLRELGRLEEAQHEIEGLLAASQDDIPIKLCLGALLQQSTQLTDAGKIYKEILQTDPQHLQANLELAKTLSHSGQMEQAIGLLTELHNVIGPNFRLMMQLGQLSASLENWNTARQWYEDVSERYPFMAQGHVALANVIFLQGETAVAIALLQKAEETLPGAIEIPIKIAHLYIQLGYPERSIEKLKSLQKLFPHHTSIYVQLSCAYLQVGAFENAQAILGQIKDDRITSRKQVAQLQGEIAFQRYDYKSAKQYFQTALDLAPTLQERNRLAIILTTMGELSQASHQLRLATEELGLKSPPGKSPIPLISHPAKVIQSFQINPLLLKQITQANDDDECIIKLGKIAIEDPAYLGVASTLMRELRSQGTFNHLKDALTGPSSTLPSIPKHIIQYWDNPQPPKDIETLNQTWIEQNPDYEYRRFSYQDALTFLKQHYSDDDRIVTAFQNCSQPATQSDFFRLAYLNKMGGFYADADDRCHKSLNLLLDRNPELIVLQEDFACIGNNFLGCIPGQITIRVAFYRAVNNLLHYSADSPWFQTGPGLLTCTLCNTLLPYLTDTDYRIWPRLWVLSQAELRSIVIQHISLPYKRTEQSWSYSAYQRRVGNA